MTVKGKGGGANWKLVMDENWDFSGKKFGEGDSRSQWRSLAWLSPIDTRVRGGRDVSWRWGIRVRRRAEAREKPEKRGATREGGRVEEEGGRRKVGSLESLAGVARGGVERRGGWTQRGSIQRCWTKVHSHLSGGRRRGYGAGVGPGEGCER